MNVKIQELIVTFLTLHLSLGVSGIAIGGPFKCGDLACPNGSLCEIIQQPNADGKSETIHTQCKTATGQLLQESTITNELPEGRIPVTSVIRKTVIGRAFGALCKNGTSPKNLAYSTDGTNSDGGTVDFVSLIDSSETDSSNSESLEIIPFNFASSFGKIWSVPRGILQSTNSFMNNLFSNLFCKKQKLAEIR